MSQHVPYVDVRCAACKTTSRPLVANFTLDPKNPSLTESPSERIAKVTPQLVADGWAVRKNEVGAFETICPACAAKEHQARQLPAFTDQAKCVMCRKADTDMVFCTGRVPTCVHRFYAPHIHRICRKCGHNWITQTAQGDGNV